ncbi:MAG TPA: septal ring lytic transglycosylase RlpA family protein [Caulobacteraceae bacterium]|jgi:rare lipoprotein A
MLPRSYRNLVLTAVALCCAGVSGCLGGGRKEAADLGAYRTANLKPYSVNGRRYTPKVEPRYEQVGLASWYSYPAGTRRTATGAWFDPGQMTAAHRTLPLPCIAEITNLENGRKVKLLVNDRGPFVDGRVIDVSKAAAEKLGFAGKGLAKVKVRFVGPAQRVAAVGGASAYTPDGEAIVLAMMATPDGAR